MSIEVIFSEAGWAPMPGWGSFQYGNSVGGIDPGGVARWKAIDMITEGHPLYGPDTPDTPEEAARWLVSHALMLNATARPAPEPEPEVSERDSISLERYLNHARKFTGGDDAKPDRVEAGVGEAAPATVDDEETIALARVADEIDAEFAELGNGLNAPQISGPQYGGDGVVEGEAMAEPPLLGEDIKDFAPDEVKRVQEGVAIFGDNLPMQRMLLIGRITEIALEKCEAAQIDWSEDEFRDLQSYVVSNLDAAGSFRGNTERYAEFVRLSDIQSIVRRIESERVKRITFIRGASREEVEAYNPEEGWP